MKKNNLTILNTIILIIIAINSPQSYANLTKTCILGMPIYTKPIVKDNPNETPIHITAKNVVSESFNFIKYKGNVDIKQGNQTITADEVKLTQTTKQSQNPIRTVVATGNVNYNNPQIILKGLKAWLNLDNKDTDIEKAEYLMVGRQGRGYANKIKLRDKNRYTILEKGMFTTCLPGNNNWSVIGSKIILDHKEEVAKLWNAHFKIANIPIFYSPYLQLPIGTRRSSGFLLPNSSYSKDLGLNFALPFYWNIIPNYDATITPQFITFRGIKLNTEFRYLSLGGFGTIAFDWLKNDHIYIKDKNSGKYQARDSNNRWLLYWGHSEILNQVWRFNIDYTKVSDLKYFTDFNSKYGNSTDGYATQKFSIGYSKPNWNVTLSHKQFQLLVDSSNSKKTYKTEPQLDINYYKNNLGLFGFKTYAQIARITNVGYNTPDATTRLHLEPELNLQLSNNWAIINNSIKMMITYYDQYIPVNLINSKLKKQVTRILPSITSDLKLIFERDLSTNSNYIQTLEPRFQYIYIPYRDQSDINNYDSSLLQIDYNGLFRNRIYSGIDRIASANKLKAGITTRVYDEELNEKFNFSLGQIYFLKYPRTENYNLSIKDKNNTGSILWAGDTYLRLNNNFGLHGKIHYDSRLNNITIGNIVTEYHIDSNRLIQLNYRFVNGDYIKEIIKNTPTFKKGISQIGAVISWPLGNQLHFVGSYYYYLKKKQPISRLIGIQYNTCCWSINIGYERNIVGWQKHKSSSDYDNKWSINIELKGLNNNPNLGNQDIIVRSILPYQQYL